MIMDDDVEEEGEIDKFNIECAILVCEFDGLMIEETGGEDDCCCGGGGGESDPNLFIGGGDDDDDE
jgi:hypothetical protein